MAEKSIASGVAPPYGIAIGNALSKGNTPTEELLALRNQVRDIVGVQGDIVATLKALDGEIAARGAGAKVAPHIEERFVAQIEGLAIPASAKTAIEEAIQKAVMAEIGKLDTRGDFIATPLSELKAFGWASGHGGHIAGRYIRPKNWKFSRRLCAAGS